MDITLELACRNLHKVGVCQANEVGPVHLLQYEKVLITAEALKNIEERLV
jgi:large subunit ribosomal protein L4